MNITTSQGPSGKNQTSDDHSLDTNQKARQPSTAEVIEADGLDTESAEASTDVTSHAK